VTGEAAELARKAARRACSWTDVARLGGIRPVARHVLSRRAEALDGTAREAAYRRVWAEAAQELGAQCRPLGGGFLEVRRGEAVTRVRRNYVMLDDVVTFTLDKRIGQDLLAERGLPVPENLVLGEAEQGQVEEFLSGSVDGCVVKPADGFSGRGVTCGLRTRREVAIAARRAAGYSRQVLLERMVLGASYRVLLLDGELLDVIRRDPPRVRGDGRSTIAELIGAENRRRVAAGGHAGFARLELDLDLLLTLRRAGLRLSSVPLAGVEVQVKTAVSGNAAAENETVRSPISCELLRETVVAAETLGVRLAGVDVITTDLSRPLATTGGAINEVNTLPALLHHLYVADPAAAPRVAVPILRTLLANAEQGPFVRSTSSGTTVLERPPAAPSMEGVRAETSAEPPSPALGCA